MLFYHDYFKKIFNAYVYVLLDNDIINNSEENLVFKFPKFLIIIHLSDICNFRSVPTFKLHRDQRGGLHNINKPKMSADEQCQTSLKFNQLLLTLNELNSN